MSYSNGIMITYRVAAYAVDTAAVSTQKIAGPSGATGRLVSMIAINTVATTVAAALVTLKNAGSAVTYGRLSVPVGGIAAVANAFSVDDVSATPLDTGRIPADTALELNSDGGATAGDADVYVTILWDKT